MKDMADQVRRGVAAIAFQDGLIGMLMAMLRIDTTPGPDVARMRDAESRVFDVIRAYLGGGLWRCEERPLTPAIADHAAFSLLHFTKTAARPRGLSPAEVYGGRANLVVCGDGEVDVRGRSPALNAHIDVIAPYFPPRLEHDRIVGRGSVDDKGNVAAVCGAMALVARLVAAGEVTFRNRVTGMFVVEEETGGNGSLALAVDRELKQRYDSILVAESADGGVYPANRGAVWFKCELRATGGGPAPSLPEAMAFGVLAMQDEGAAIKRASDHPLFPHRPVQTCNGMLGPHGGHPSRINGRLPFTIGPLDADGEAAARAAFERGLADYVARWGDKTRVIDPATGKPKVARHLDIAAAPGGGLAVTVHGSTGHMGAILQNDDAILKWACLVREWVACRRRLGLTAAVAVEGHNEARWLALEGGQGFLPTHAMRDVQARMAAAFERGVQAYVTAEGLAADTVSCATTYAKLHNDAFACDPDSPTMRCARRAALDAGMPGADAPARGWDVSCDARLFAAEYPDMPVVTAGVGALAAAHSDDEYLRLDEFWKTVAFYALFMLYETGTV